MTSYDNIMTSCDDFGEIKIPAISKEKGKWARNPRSVPNKNSVRIRQTTA